MAGGKGRTSRKTPLEIEEYGEKYGLPNELQQLKYASRMAAKVDNNASLMIFSNEQTVKFTPVI